MKQPKRPHVRLRNFWKFVEKADGCWKWTGPKWKGYGMLGKTRAPRFSYELHHGPLFPGWVVCHRCDNPECTNPAHLFAASQQANLKDMRAKIVIFGEIERIVRTVTNTQKGTLES